MKRLPFLTLLIVLSLIISACAAQSPNETTPAPIPETASTPEPTLAPTATAEPTMEPTEAPMTIVDVAASDGRFTTLVAAVQAAGLVETLSGEGPFTVFAPTDEAFANLPEGTLDTLLMPENQQQLTDILTYHVVPGRVMASDVVNLTEAQTVQGESINIRTEDGKVFVNDAEVIITDVEASNGVIHVIDAVILPGQAMSEETDSGETMSEPMDIVDTAAADERFTTLVAAVQAAGLVETLKGEGPFTVFAPTNDAFAALPEGTVDSLLMPENQQQLIDILTYHVVSGKVMAEDVVNLTEAETVLGETVNIRVEDGRVFINDAEVIITDIEATNGVIHVIDAVLLPPQ